MSEYSVKIDKLRPDGYEFPVGLTDDGTVGTNVAATTTGGLQKCIGGDTGNTFHIFANPSGSGNFVSSFNGEVDILLVGGGGAGGGGNTGPEEFMYGGGGGGGGVTYVSNYPVKPQASYAVVVGAGGTTDQTRGPGNEFIASTVRKGANSSFTDTARPVHPDNTTLLGGGGSGGGSRHISPMGGGFTFEGFGSTGGTTMPGSYDLGNTPYSNPLYPELGIADHQTATMNVAGPNGANAHSYLRRLNPPVNPVHPALSIRFYAHIGGSGGSPPSGDDRNSITGGGGGAGQHGGGYGGRTGPAYSPQWGNAGYGLMPRPPGLHGGSGVYIPEMVEAELGTPGGKQSPLNPFPTGTNYGFFGGGGCGKANEGAAPQLGGPGPYFGPGPAGSPEAPNWTWHIGPPDVTVHLGWGGGAGGGGGGDWALNPSVGRTAASGSLNGAANTGGGGAGGGGAGGGTHPSTSVLEQSGSGGSGIVVIKYKTHKKNFIVN